MIERETKAQKAWKREFSQVEERPLPASLRFALLRPAPPPAGGGGRPQLTERATSLPSSLPFVVVGESRQVKLPAAFPLPVR
jgi:hypothetical protein